MSEIPPTSVPEPQANAARQQRSIGQVPPPMQVSRDRQRYDFFRGRDAAVVGLGSFRPRGDDALRENSRVLTPGPGASVCATPGRPLLERSVMVLPTRSADPPVCGVNRALTPGWERALSIRGEVRCPFGSTSLPQTPRGPDAPGLLGVQSLSEVAPYLRGGERCKALFRKFELTCEMAIQRYEISFIAAVVACPSPTTARIAELAEATAAKSVEFVVRRAQEPTMEYAALVFVLELSRGVSRCIGSFNSEGVAPEEVFGHFSKLDTREGIPVVRLNPELLHFSDNKIHVSVHRDDMPEAWEALQPLLLSADNPFLKWKMTLLDHVDARYQDRLDDIALRERLGETGIDADRERENAADRRRRIADGMQFTLYPVVPAIDSNYRIFGSRFRHFLTLLDWALEDRGVRPGAAPESDVAIDGLKFSTYRHGACGTRGQVKGEPPVTEEMTRQLTETAFYKAIKR